MSGCFSITVGAPVSCGQRNDAVPPRCHSEFCSSSLSTVSRFYASRSPSVLTQRAVSPLQPLSPAPPSLARVPASPSSSHSARSARPLTPFLPLSPFSHSLVRARCISSATTTRTGMPHVPFTAPPLVQTANCTPTPTVSSSHPSPSLPRSLGLAAAAAAVSVLLSLSPGQHRDVHRIPFPFAVPAAAAATSPSPQSSPPTSLFSLAAADVAPDTSADVAPDSSRLTASDVSVSPKASPSWRAFLQKEVTQRVYLDFSLCPTAVRTDRTLGDMSLICRDGEPMGRVEIGLFGKRLPVTTEHFRAMVGGESGSTYKGSIVSKIFPGSYMLAGRQGPTERGGVAPPNPEVLKRNSEAVKGEAFELAHDRPGLVSLAIAENDDEEERRLDFEYRNVEFMITTGPGPSSQLDDGNIVFGYVLNGIDVISKIASIPIFDPSENIKQFNELAEFFGDDRAANARNAWNRPLKAIVISDCGVL